MKLARCKALPAFAALVAFIVAAPLANGAPSIHSGHQTLMLDVSGEIAGTVVGPAGHGVGKARVTIKPVGMHTETFHSGTVSHAGHHTNVSHINTVRTETTFPGITHRTGPRGRFEFKNLHGGKYRITVTKHGFLPKTVLATPTQIKKGITIHLTRLARPRVVATVRHQRKPKHVTTVVVTPTPKVAPAKKKP